MDRGIWSLSDLVWELLCWSGKPVLTVDPADALVPQASPCHCRLSGLWVEHASHTVGCLLAARLYSGYVLADSTMLNVALLHKWGRFSWFFLRTVSPEETVVFFLPSGS